MLEVEVKAKIDDLKSVERRLQNLGARFKGEEEQEDLYFNHPSRDFSETDEALRLRRVGDVFYLTYKGPKLHATTKTRMEQEVRIGDFDTARQVLENLGFKPVMTVRKNRRVYAYKNYIISLDSVIDLGDFVEVEDVVGRDPDNLLAFLRELGISSEKSERRSYLELLLERRRRS